MEPNFYLVLMETAEEAPLGLYIEGGELNNAILSREYSAAIEFDVNVEIDAARVLPHGATYILTTTGEPGFEVEALDGFVVPANVAANEVWMAEIIAEVEAL